MICGYERAQSCRIGSNQVCGHGRPRSGLNGGVGRHAERRRAHASDLVAGKIGDEGAVERPVERETPVAHLLGDAELPAELHGADAHFEHLGGAELVLVALDQHRRDAAPAEIGGERKPDRAAACDQHRRFDGGGCDRS